MITKIIVIKIDGNYENRIYEFENNKAMDDFFEEFSNDHSRGKIIGMHPVPEEYKNHIKIKYYAKE